MDEINALFQEEVKNHTDDSVYDGASRIIEDAEYDFKHMTDEQKLREEEKKDIKKKIGHLKKYRNIKNPKLRHVNEQRAEKRNYIKKQIAEYNLRLQDIEEEEKGSNINAQDLVRGAQQ